MGAMSRNTFALAARSTPGEALERHTIDEKHWIEKGYVPNHWEGMMADSDAIKRLLERLQNGWAPQADEIEPAVSQVDALIWQRNVEDAGTIVPLGITYQTIDRQPRKTGSVLYIDEHLTYALTAEGIFWLYRSGESEKVRYLGG